MRRGGCAGAADCRPLADGTADGALRQPRPGGVSAVCLRSAFGAPAVSAGLSGNKHRSRAQKRNAGAAAQFTAGPGPDFWRQVSGRAGAGGADPQPEPPRGGRLLCPGGDLAATRRSGRVRDPRPDVAAVRGPWTIGEHLLHDDGRRGPLDIRPRCPVQCAAARSASVLSGNGIVPGRRWKLAAVHLSVRGPDVAGGIGGSGGSRSCFLVLGAAALRGDFTRSDRRLFGLGDQPPQLHDLRHLAGCRSHER
jgi:hypothetical protein